MEKDQITGIVLCGGKSSRMGMNKGLLKLGQISLFQHVVNSLKQVCGKIIISSNSTDFKEIQFKIVQDKYSGIGPISGIYSSLSESDNQHNIIATCDTPFVSPQLLQYLLEHSKGFDIVLPEINGKLQSLTGYFNKSILPSISDEIKKSHNKPIQIFKSLNINILQINESLRFYHDYLFFNINTVADYKEACRIYRNIST